MDEFKAEVLNITGLQYDEIPEVHEHEFVKILARYDYEAYATLVGITYGANVRRAVIG